MIILVVWNNVINRFFPTMFSHFNYEKSLIINLGYIVQIFSIFGAGAAITRKTFYIVVIIDPNFFFYAKKIKNQLTGKTIL